MGIKIDRVGTFRCRLVEKGLGKTKIKESNEKDPGGYPQLITKVVMTGLFDEKGGENGEPIWFPVEDWDMGTTAYSLLYGFLKKEKAVGKTLTCQQIMKVFNWDGVSLAELITKDDNGLEFQIRIEENDPEYADKNPFQVSWIDTYDADPVHTLRKLNAKEIAALDAQFSSVVPSTKGAKSAKKAGPKAPVKTPHPARVPADDGPKRPTPPTAAAAPAEEKVEKPPTAAEKKAITKARSDKIKKAAAEEKAKKIQAANAKAVAPKGPTPPPVPEEVETEAPADSELPLPEADGSITKAEAWARIFEMRDETINDDTVKALWDAAIEEVAGEGAKHADLTGEQWSQVVKIVLADCGKF